MSVRGCEPKLLGASGGVAPASADALAIACCSDDLGQARPVELGDRAVAIDERGGEAGVAVNGDAVAARQAEKLGRERAPPGGAAHRNGPSRWLPGDRD